MALKAYLTEIAQSLSRACWGAPPAFASPLSRKLVEIDSDRSMPFGLLVNELSTNAVKHAFPGGIGVVTLLSDGSGTRSS